MLSSCGDHVHQLTPGEVPPPDAGGGTVPLPSIDAGREAALAFDVGASDANIGPTGLWTADPNPALAAQSPSCLECAASSCGIYVAGCATIAGLASDGPAEGTAKSELCVETLECVLSSACAWCVNPTGSCFPITRFGQCYCGQPDDVSVRLLPELCMPPSPDLAGPCKTALERSLETTTSSTLLASFGDTSKGGSWAMLLMQCLIDNKCQSCFPAPDGGFEGGDGAAARR